MSDQESAKKAALTEVRVLIIAHKKNQFIQAAQFLERRGVPCTIKGNVRDGIQFITKEKPFVVFLSWNLPNSNILKTYQLLTRALNTDCIVFAEKDDGKTSAELNNSKIPDTMHAPVSGPGFFMRIQKLIKSKEEVKNSSAKQQARKTNAQLVRKSVTEKEIKNTKEIPSTGHWEQAGVDSEDGEPIYVFKSSNPNPKKDGKPGYYTFKGKHTPELKSDGTWDETKGKFAYEESEQEPNRGPGIINFQTPKYDEEDYEDSTDDSSMNNIDDLISSVDLSDEENSKTLLEEKNADESRENNDLFAESTDTTTDFESEEHKKNRKKHSDYGSVLNVAKPVEHSETPLPEYEVTKPKESVIIGENSSSNYKFSESMIVEPQVSSKVPNSLLLQQTFEALKSAVRPAKAEHDLVQKIAKAKVLNIHSNRFKGYLIIVIPMFHELDRTVFSKIKENLANMLKGQGEALRQFEELNVDIEEVNFKTWSKEHAEFTIATLDGDQEIIISYIPHDETLPSVEEKDNSMASVKASDLAPDTKTKFNLFLHLPKNNKFIRYLKNGDTVTKKHSDKFNKHKADSLHIKKDEIHSFKEYFASNQLQKKSKKKAS